jgi:2-polyprenyl-3-methyl-5-hydroxy-6-metoxy-1,4-benzoquinol methylase
MNDLIYFRPDHCRACGARLVPWFDKVRDHVYGVEGEWRIHRCSNTICAAGYLDAGLTAVELNRFYDTYSTHHPPVLAATGAKLLFRQAIDWILHKQLGYNAPEVTGIAKTVGAVLATIPFFRAAALARAFWLPAVTNGKLVEIGFGNGQSLVQMRKLGWQVEGVEFDEVCIKDAKALGFEVFMGDFESQTYRDGTLDAVVGSHVIEHVPDPGRLVSTIYQKLVPGGRLVFVTPNAASWGCKTFRTHWRGLEAPRHLTIQTPHSLALHAQQAGFTKIRVFGTPLGGGILQQSMRILEGKASSPAGRVGRLGWNVIASLIHIIRPQAADEVVLICEK